MTTARHAIVLLSGGLDSATVLAWARQEGFVCHALTVRYGQRHAHEVDCAIRIGRAAGIEHRVVELDLSAFGGSSLFATGDPVPKRGPAAELGAQQLGAHGAGPGEASTEDRGEASTEVPSGASTEDRGERRRAERAQEHIPSTYVPARNTVLLSLALAWAEAVDAEAIFLGVNAVDYSGYPDCRPEYLDAFQRLADLATRRGVAGRPILVRAPLLRWTKSKIIREGLRLGVPFEWTSSCYDPDDRGRPCGLCDSCRLRARGFEEAGVPDPLAGEQ